MNISDAFLRCIETRVTRRRVTALRKGNYVNMGSPLD